jgi:membrane protein implicated in regulation of membrane protease activity
MGQRINRWLLAALVLAALLVLASLALVAWRASLAASPVFRVAGLVLAAAYVAWFVIAWYLRRRERPADPPPRASAPGKRKTHLRRVK